MHHDFLKFLTDLKVLWKTPHTEFLDFQSFLTNLLFQSQAYDWM